MISTRPAVERLPVVGLVHNVAQDRLPNNHLPQVLPGLPGVRLVLTDKGFNSVKIFQSHYLSSVGIGSFASGQSRGVDVGESQSELRRRTVPGSAADDDGPAVHHLLHHAFPPLLGGSGGSGRGGNSLCLVLLCGHAGYSMFHTGLKVCKKIFIETLYVEHCAWSLIHKYFSSLLSLICSDEVLSELCHRSTFSPENWRLLEI